MFYSAHDTTIAPMWEFLDASNLEINSVLYASNI